MEGAYANSPAVAASRMIHRCWGGCCGTLRGEGKLGSAWEGGTSVEELFVLFREE